MLTPDGTSPGSETTRTKLQPVQQRLVLNTAPIIIPDTNIPVGRQPFRDASALRSDRERHRDTHIFKRRGDSVIDIPVCLGASPLGAEEDLCLKDDFGICKALILNAYLDYLFRSGREIFSYSPVEFLARDDLLSESVPRDTVCPDWMSVRLRYQIDIRMHQTDSAQGMPVIALALRTAIVLDGSCADLAAYGLDLVGKYVLTEPDKIDPRLRPRRRLAGRIIGTADKKLLLDDTRADETSIEAGKAFLEPRRENLRFCMQAIFGEKSETIWHRLFTRMWEANEGKAKLNKIQGVLSFLARQNLELCPGVSFQIGDLQAEGAGCTSFPMVSRETPPVYVFGPSQKTDTWHNRGLEKFGPYDQSTFTPVLLGLR